MQTTLNRTRIDIVQSRQNRRVKELRAALTRGGINADGRVGIEGMHLLEEAVRSGLAVPTIFLRTGSAGLLDRLRVPDESEILELPPDVFHSVVTTESPQGIAALACPRSFRLADVFSSASPLILVTAGLQDPGNLGTLVRSAEAFGASGLLTLPGTVNLWNAKSLRASSGSAFRLPVISVQEEELFASLKSHGIRLLAAAANGGQRAPDTNLTQPIAVLIGNEGSGVSEALLDRCDGAIAIPCPGRVESLNAAVAGSVLLYEASRQRRR